MTTPRPDHNPGTGTGTGTEEPTMTDALARRLGLGDAVVIGVASMLGAGVFAVLAPAARAAGPLLLLGLLVAAVVAYANATSTAQLAAVLPASGGAYLFGRERLGPWWGYAAGWCFVVGKTASCAAMAMTFAAYVVPAAQRPIAVAAVVALVAVNARGITRTARLSRVLVGATLVVLALVVVVGATSAACCQAGAGAGPGVGGGAEPGAYGVLQSAGLLFFALAGYARVATLGEEVRDPRVVIPRAIQLALAAVLVVYLAVAVVALGVLGPARLASSPRPLADVVTVAGYPALTAVVGAGAALACLGALLGLIAGVGRTAFAMAREGDLPRGLDAVHPRFGVPHRAEYAVGAAVVVLVLVADLRGVIAFSSFGVLLYYAVANAAAFTQRGSERRWPRAVQVVGLGGCLLLAATLPWRSVLLGVGVLAVGLAARLLAHRRR